MDGTDGNMLKQIGARLGIDINQTRDTDRPMFFTYGQCFLTKGTNADDSVQIVIFTKKRSNSHPYKLFFALPCINIHTVKILISAGVFISGTLTSLSLL